MLQTISLDAKTIIVRADTENDLSEIIELISKQQNRKSLDILLNFASKNRKIEKEYKFDRNNCYDE